MSAKLHVIALISGGKDSFFSLLHCLRNGHEVVALANLYPEDTGIEDSESYMYQTIGHAMIPLYADALGIPLYRAPITGSATNTDKIYQNCPLSSNDDSAAALITDANSGTESEARSLSTTHTNPDPPLAPDETESLLPLLTHILAHHPNANALSTGAILSTYQRTRIESVAARLHLTSLAYLWQYPSLPPYTQTSLLHDIGAVGQDSRIVKTASGGLDELHLWARVGDALVVGRLVKDMGRFAAALEDGACLGEGGEYETLTLDGPAVLWKGKIEVPEEGREVVPGEGGSWALRISGASLVEKEYISGAEEPGEQGLPRVPNLYDDEFAAVLEALAPNGASNGLKPTRPARDSDHTPTVRSICKQLQLDHSTAAEDDTIYISNLTSHSETNTTAATQMTSIASSLHNLLYTYNLTPDNLTSTTILLRHMSDFSALNTIYGSLFTRSNPPARVTIACGDALPTGVAVTLSATASKLSSTARRGLHVQSRSYWAPANIGPYSQAVALPLMQQQQHDDWPAAEIVHVAGQIALVPASMELVSGGFAQQAVLSLQHLWRIGRAMGVRWWGGAVAFVVDTEEEARERSAVAVAAWRDIHAVGDGQGECEDDAGDEDEEVDIAERSLRSPWASGGGGSGFGTASVKTLRPRLPNREGVRVFDAEGQPRYSSKSTPRCFVLQVDELPRGAAVEWAAFGFAGEALRVSVTEDDGQGVCEVRSGVDTAFRVTCLDVLTAAEMDAFCHELVQMRRAGDRLGGLLEIFTPHVVSEEVMGCAGVMVMPCRRVWNEHGEKLHAAVRHRGHFTIAD